GCRVEVDAFSYGIDDPMTIAGIAPGALQFAVDRFAQGFGPQTPNVLSEAIVADSAGDIFLNVNFLPPGPLPPGPSVGHRGVLDGDGMVSGSGFAYMGLGLIEPAPPVSTPVNPGDNLDAMDTLAASAIPGPDVYYSLDAVHPDPLSGFPNLGSALPYGFTGADILKSTFGFPPVLYANEWQLGLGLSGLADDVDAMILVENGNGTFQPSQTPFDWVGGTTD
ncbi:MAG: hypothetical protein KDB61_16505, partial [Planctomycetes bacterium]|nr:hypothetical protein [Planctomycetota bacterium]